MSADNVIDPVKRFRELRAAGYNEVACVAKVAAELREEAANITKCCADPAEIEHRIRSLNTNAARQELPAVTSASRQTASGSVQAVHPDGDELPGNASVQPTQSARDSAQYPAVAAPAETPSGPTRWRVLDELGDDLISLWKRCPRHSNEYAAAEIIEELERRCQALEQAIHSAMASIQARNYYLAQTTLDAALTGKPK